MWNCTQDTLHCLTLTGEGLLNVIKIKVNQISQLANWKLKGC